MTVFRARWRIKGDHVHVRIFVGSSNSTLALCGKLVMTRAEFRAFRQATAADTFKILPEESEIT